jgi:hypothetical protein
VQRVLVGKPEGKRPMGRPRRRWEMNIKMDLQEVGGGCGDRMERAQDRDRWRALVSIDTSSSHPTHLTPVLYLDWSVLGLSADI